MTVAIVALFQDVGAVDITDERQVNLAERGDHEFTPLAQEDHLALLQLENLVVESVGFGGQLLLLALV